MYFCLWRLLLCIHLQLGLESQAFYSSSHRSFHKQYASSSELFFSQSHSENNSLDGVTHLTNIERVLCLSDLHTDHAENMKWLENRTSIRDDLGETDLIVVAGDISHDLETFEKSLSLLMKRNSKVLFLPGNHEAWLSAHELNDGNSLRKLDRVYEICKTLGVLTGCTLVGGTEQTPFPLWIVPLESWYDGSLSLEGCEDLCDDFIKWPWVDFIRCRWPQFPQMGGPNAKIPSGLADYFVNRNQAIISLLRTAMKQFEATTQCNNAGAVMTVSHFLPNKQCLPDWKDLNAPIFLRHQWLEHGAAHMSAKFAKVAGTILLDEQIRAEIKADEGVRHIHVFGHSHRPKDFEFQNVRYVHNPLGKPREREIHMVSPDIDLQVVWSTRNGEVPGETVIRYWEEK